MPMTLHPVHTGVLALIDRNFQGFGKELFTDAGKYVVHFGNNPTEAAEQAANTVEAAHPDKPRPQITPLARVRTDVAVIPTQTGNQLVSCPPQPPTPFFHQKIPTGACTARKNR